MKADYEIVRYKHGLNARILMHGINQYKLHWHREIEILLVLKGQVTIAAEGKLYELAEDDLLLINSGEPHSTIGGKDNVVAVLQISPDFCGKTFPGLEQYVFAWPQDKRANSESLLKHIRFFIALVIDEYRRSERGYELAIDGILNALMSLILRNVPARHLSAILADQQDKDKSRIRKLTEYIQTHCAEEITLRQLAAEAYLSPYYLSHFFKKKMGITFQDYLTLARLQSAVNFLSQTDKRITEIAMLCGFPSIRSFNTAFKKQYGTTPREYRRQEDFFSAMREKTAYLEYDSVQALEKLRQYREFTLSELEFYQSPLLLASPVSTETAVNADLGKAGKPLFPNWKQLAAVGRAYDCLRGDMQAQIARAARELGTEHLRFHGIFNDEMRVVSRDAEGKLRFRWNYVDKIFDFLTGLGIRPLADLTFVPGAMKSRDKTRFWYRGNYAPPRDWDEWFNLIYCFALHCLDRYGAEEVRNWYFEIWNEPDLMWGGTAQDYYRFYQVSAEALLRADPALRIAGASVCSPWLESSLWLDGFVDFINTRDPPLHCFTFHFYGEQDFIRYDTAESGSKYYASYGGKDYLSECIDIYRDKISRLKRRPAEWFITEYNISARHKNYLLDTMFTACHILYNYLRNHDKVQGIAFWTLSDIFEEDPYLSPPFSGGFGLLTAEGIRKPAWHALRFLRQIQGEILEQGEEYIVTKRGDTLYILGFCYLHYDKIYMAGDHSLVSPASRYEVFESKPPVTFRVSLRGIQGAYRVWEYTLDRGHGSAFDIYADMGAPRSLSAEDAEYLRNTAVPR
ncbi:MAG: helix-turn-helix domain-containing protein, partial [Treponema sp.]|nr:helix-turn-helix domain-containing protein [Treponema sp.]